MKTVKYFIQFDNLDIDMSSMIEISKCEYEKQYLHLIAKVTETKEDEYQMEHFNFESEFGGYIQYEEVFQIACARTTLYKQVCKEGYRFKTKIECNRG